LTALPNLRSGVSHTPAAAVHTGPGKVSAVTGRELRRLILSHSKRAYVGHIGSGLSVADILAVVYGDLIEGRPGDPERDRFILSKGHAALALYAALATSGRISLDLLQTFGTDGTQLGVHPEYQVPGIDFSTGSLGMGMSFAAGAVLAARLQGSKRKAYVLLSDAECNEGSVWESAMFAAHHGLSSLTAFIDLNGQQALGYTRDVLAATNMAERWRAFGWDAIEVDGHDRGVMRAAAQAPRDRRPRVLVCRTTFGKGVSFMESQIKWHYLPMSDAEYAAAMGEVEAALCE
jgi:transketolase